jgi:hypothetical protein
MESGRVGWGIESWERAERKKQQAHSKLMPLFALLLKSILIVNLLGYKSAII